MVSHVGVDGITREEMLRYAIDKKDIEKIKECIQTGVDVNHLDTLGASPIFYAEDLEVIKLLVENGADVFQKSSTGNTVLFWANSCEAIDFYVNEGIQVQDRNQFGWTALHNFVDTGVEPKCVRHLCERGADVNALNMVGCTPIFYADSADMLKTLLDMGADTSIVNENGNSLADYYMRKIKIRVDYTNFLHIIKTYVPNEEILIKSCRS